MGKLPHLYCIRKPHQGEVRFDTTFPTLHRRLAHTSIPTKANLTSGEGFVNDPKLPTLDAALMQIWPWAKRVT